MTKPTKETTRQWYEEAYAREGYRAQRNYPNEELLRFMGRHFFSKDGIDRSAVKVLEVGCGTCANLWMIGREGFDAYGIDLSAEAIELGRLRLAHWGTGAKLEVGSMTELPYEENTFDVIVDVFSSNCLDMNDFQRYLAEAARVTKTGGRMIMYTPTSESDAFKNHAPAEKIDPQTLNGIYRKDSPFHGNYYPFRFSSVEWLKETLNKYGFDVSYAETITRSYNDRSEVFQHVTIEAVKK